MLLIVRHTHETRLAHRLSVIIECWLSITVILHQRRHIDAVVVVSRPRINALRPLMVLVLGQRGHVLVPLLSLACREVDVGQQLGILAP